MVKADALRVERLPREFLETFLQGRVANPRIARRSVDWIADDRETRGREVHPDLVRAARDQAAAEEREPQRKPIALELIERVRLARGRRSIRRRLAEGLHLLAIPRVASDRQRDLAL